VFFFFFCNGVRCYLKVLKQYCFRAAKTTKKGQQKNKAEHSRSHTTQEKKERTKKGNPLP